MTWSNVGDEPGFNKIKKPTPTQPKGHMVRMKGGPAKVGNRKAETGPERADRLRRLARRGHSR